MLLATTALALLGGAPDLSADPVFPVPGSSVTFELAATPGAGWILLASLAPFELDLGDPGVFFLDPTDLTTIGGGLVPGGGTASLVLPVPSQPAFVGLEIYTQAAEVVGADFAMSQGVALRIEEEPPAGGRATIALAASPDGATVIAAHRNDGTLSVVEAATGTVRAQLPTGPSARDHVLGAVHVAVDPDGRHAFALNAAAEAITVVHVATSSIAAKIPVPVGCKRVAFDFGGATPRLYVTNEAEDAVLVFDEPLPGFFVAAGELAVEGSRPGPVALLPDGRLAVADQGSRELEILDPAQPGAPSVDRLAINRMPLDLVAHGGELIVAAFSRQTAFGGGDGHNEVHRFAVSPSLAPVASHFFDLGTDYVDLDVAGDLLAVTCAGSGTLLLADATTFAVHDVVELAPGQPTATPQQAAVVLDAGQPTSVWVANYFRESLREVTIGAGPSFALGQEVALAHSGAVRVPLVDLTLEEDGDRFFRSVEFFNGTAANPNDVTCTTCHPDNGTDGVVALAVNNVLTVWNTGETPPLGSTGALSDLGAALTNAFNAHTTLGGSLSPTVRDAVEAFLLSSVQPPPSPFDGSSTEALAGKTLFEGAAGCASCHAAPLFVPIAPDPATIAAGVGTGLAPANVPSLRGAWASAPYFHDGSAATLLDVLERDTGDLHGATSALTAQQRDELAAYLRTL